MLQASGSGKTELHKLLKEMVLSVMTKQQFPIADIMVNDATAAALRECMAKSQNMLITLSDEYKMTLASLKVGSQVILLFYKPLLAPDL